MDKQDFWTIIDAVHAESGGDLDRKCTLLEMRLHSLADDEIIDFIDHFDAADAAAYTWPLWGAASSCTVDARTMHSSTSVPRSSPRDKTSTKGHWLIPIH